MGILIYILIKIKWIDVLNAEDYQSKNERNLLDYDVMLVDTLQIKKSDERAVEPLDSTLNIG